MKKLYLIILILAVLISPVNAYPLDNNSDIAVIREEKIGITRIKLFNGRNLDGWYTYIKERGKNTDPLNVFTVNKGIIRISAEEYGCITTNNEFEYYKLTWMYSIECQIIEGGSGDFIVVGDGSTNFSITCPVAEEKQGNSYVFKPGGNPVIINSGRINWFARDPGWKDVKDFRGSKDLEKSLGKWNLIECIVNGNEIRIYLNGVLVNQALNVKPDKGKIQIQSEGAEIFFKKILIYPL